MISAQKFWYNKLILLVIIIFEALYLQVWGFNVYGAITACSASVSPTTLTASTSTSLTFSVTNNDGAAAAVSWVKINAPSADFETTGGSVSGWSADFSASDITFTGNNFEVGESVSFTVNITTGSSEVSASSFLVEVSNDSGGSNPTSCSGSTSVAITSLGISAITISDISDSVAKINWTTSRATTGTLNYGTTTGYGSSKSDTNSSTSHSVEISSLGANTTYHFNISSTDGSTTVSSGDNTFTTAKAGTTTTSTVTVTNTVTKTVKDVKTPRVSLSLDFDKKYERAPLIVGTATDESGVVKVEYSMDKGKNWTLVDSIDDAGAKRTGFEFTPIIFEDGNYAIVVRAKDPSGNTGFSAANTLVIDRLPPQVGSSLFAVGPQILTPDVNGSIYTTVNIKHKLIVSSVGGTTEITVRAMDGGSEVKSFTLSKNIENGLWYGEILFDRDGDYTLVANSVDGGKNRTLRDIARVVVKSSGRVQGESGNPVESVKITIYFYEASLKKYVIWDGASFEQQNPQNTNSEGSFSFIVPEGKYFIEIDPEKGNLVRSQVFVLARSTVLNSPIILKNNNGFRIGPITLPFLDFLRNTLQINIQVADRGSDVQDGVTGKELPIVDLFKEDGKVSTLELRGKPTVLSVISNWSGSDIEQLNILDGMENSNEVNFVPVISQEKPSFAGLVRKRARLNLEVYTDSDGLLTEPLDIHSLPAHFFIDRKGIIKKIMYGVLSKEDLISNIIN